MFLVATGDQYWVFDAERKITGPESVWRLGLPVGNIQAALKWHQNGVETVYLLKSPSYWSMDPRESRVDDVYPHSMWEWEGVPSHMDAAFQDRHGESGSHAKVPEDPRVFGEGRNAANAALLLWQATLTS